MSGKKHFQIQYNYEIVIFVVVLKHLVPMSWTQILHILHFGRDGHRGLWLAHCFTCHWKVRQECEGRGIVKGQRRESWHLWIKKWRLDRIRNEFPWSLLLEFLLNVLNYRCEVGKLQLILLMMTSTLLWRSCGKKFFHFSKDFMASTSLFVLKYFPVPLHKFNELFFFVPTPRSMIFEFVNTFLFLLIFQFFLFLDTRTVFKAREIRTRSIGFIIRRWTITHFW